MEFLISAISIGILGSFHCIGMCGPIALALPLSTTRKIKPIFQILIYNTGRIATYSIFGLLSGLIGKLFFSSGLQQTLSITIGILILFFLLIPKRYSGSNKLSGTIFKGMNLLKNQMAQLFKRSGNKSIFLIGLLNGLLPCGLVYIALAGAIATGNEWKGALFMAVFGLGTLPVMAAVSFFKNLISVSYRNKMRKAVPMFVSAMAILLILRGLNLGIPYLSPSVNPETNTISCCEGKTQIHCKKIK